MKLDYATIISPYPLFLQNIGNVKSPTLKSIWSPSVTYQGYRTYLGLLMMTFQTHYVQTGQPREDQSDASGDAGEERELFDIIAADKSLQTSYCDMLSFFLVEKAAWDSRNKFFITYNESEDHNKVIPVGVINRTVFPQLCDIILQRCGISRPEPYPDAASVKNSRAREIMKKLQKGRSSSAKSSQEDKDMELPNLIAAIAVKSNSLNFMNIWNLTVCQLYEQFKREQRNVYFDIRRMAVAAYGDEKKTFSGNEWYKAEQE